MLAVAAAYLWAHPAHSKDIGPTTELVFRTDRALPEKDGFVQTSVTIGKASTFAYTVSPRLHCYLASADGRVAPGRRVRVRIGKDGALLDRTFVVQSPRLSFFRGRYLGCGADRQSRAMFFGTEPEPFVAPQRIFFTADAGPYLRDIRWTDWGSEFAVGHGRFVSDCASCGTPEHKPAVVVMHGLVACPQFGGFVYRYGHFTRQFNGARRTRPIPSAGTLYC
jgi:hypothetical protein